MRTVSEYLKKAAEYAAMVVKESDPALKKRYSDMAASYQIMAEERRKLIEAGERLPDPPRSN